MEFAHSDYLQRGQYLDAKNLLEKIASKISKLGGRKAWNKTKQLYWIVHRMGARQQIESFGIGPQTDPSKSFNQKYPKGFHMSVVPDPITTAEMTDAAFSESGMLLVYVLHGVNICSKDEKNSCQSNVMLSWAVKQSGKLIENLETRKSLSKYTKGAAHMLHQVMLGIIEFAELVRPHGLDCIARKHCKIKGENVSRIISKVMAGPLKKATKIQKNDMIPTNRTPTILFMPSFEIYGHVLLLFKKYTEAKEMFEESLQERMGRTLALLGLARAHSMLGTKLDNKTTKADYLYNYLRTQLKDADEDNPVKKEAERWLKSKDDPETLRNHWFSPYFTPESTRHQKFTIQNIRTRGVSKTKSGHFQKDTSYHDLNMFGINRLN